jgi:hypothetical protein
VEEGRSGPKEDGMRNRSIPAGLIVAALALALAGANGARELRSPGPALADTLSVDRLSQVTMEPIRVVVPNEAWLESVTMELILVVIPRPEGANPSSRKSPRP